MPDHGKNEYAFPNQPKSRHEKGFIRLMRLRFAAVAASSPIRKTSALGKWQLWQLPKQHRNLGVPLKMGYL
jgi:hypothetical protein